MIWMLDLLLDHLIEIVTQLEQQHIGSVSLSDPTDTTTEHGRLVFRHSSRVRMIGDLCGFSFRPSTMPLLGHPKGLSKAGEQKARIGESLSKEAKYSV